jgi:peptidoglycan/LPS O-acetylase OafA/YrhL
MTILNSTVSVDTFFVLSGLLVTYNVLKMLARTKGKLNIPMFYVHRYLRLTPVYAVLVGVMATLVPYTGSGPYWVIMERWGEICETNWWTNMLYVNNFVNTSWLVGSFFSLSLFYKIMTMLITGTVPRRSLVLG